MILSFAGWIMLIAMGGPILALYVEWRMTGCFWYLWWGPIIAVDPFKDRLQYLGALEWLEENEIEFYNFGNGVIKFRYSGMAVAFKLICG
jgi:hypothetical protein